MPVPIQVSGGPNYIDCIKEVALEIPGEAN